MKRRILLWVVYMSLLACLAPSVFCNETPVAVYVSFSKPSVFLGEKIDYIVTVSMPKGWILVSDLSRKAHEEEVSYRLSLPMKIRTWESHDRITMEGKQQVQFFNTENSAISEYTIEVRSSLGEIISITVPAVQITITRMIADNEENIGIRDLKPLLSLRNVAVVKHIGLIIGIAGAVIIVVRLSRRSRRNKTVLDVPLSAVETKEVAPDQLTYKVLEEIHVYVKKEHAITAQQVHQIEEVIKKYVNSRYHIETNEKTTLEIMDDISEKLSEVNVKMMLQDILTQCDLVKFAKYKLKEKEAEKLIGVSKSFVDHTAVDIRALLGET